MCCLGGSLPHAVTAGCARLEDLLYAEPVEALLRGSLPQIIITLYHLCGFRSSVAADLALQDAVSLCDESGHEFARGLSNFDSKVRGRVLLMYAMSHRIQTHSKIWLSQQVIRLASCMFFNCPIACCLLSQHGMPLPQMSMRLWRTARSQHRHCQSSRLHSSLNRLMVVVYAYRRCL
jgi:hypothetical protein